MPTLVATNAVEINRIELFAGVQFVWLYEKDMENVQNTSDLRSIVLNIVSTKNHRLCCQNEIEYCCGIERERASK